MRVNWTFLFLGLGLFGLVALTHFHSYLLFHSLVEVFSIVVAASVFLIVWNTRDFAEEGFLIFLGVAWLFMAVVEVLHMLAYPGMGVFSNLGTNPSIQLWLVARAIESVSLALAPFFLKRKVRPRLLVAIYALVTTLLLSLIFPFDVFPNCFIEGVGLTRFKIGAEIVIGLLFLVAAAHFFRARTTVDPGVISWLVGACAISAISEMCFSLYTHPYAPANLVGHLLKVVAFYLIYEALVATGLREPYRLLFRKLRESERALHTTESRFAAFMWHMPGVAFMKDSQGRYIYANDYLGRVFGVSPAEILGKQDSAFLPDDVAGELRAHDRRVLDEGARLETLETVPEGGQIRRWLTIKFPVVDEQDRRTVVGGLAIDITQRVEAEEALHRSQRELEVRNRIAHIFLTSPGDEIYSEVLNIVLDVMDSPLGVFAYLDPEDGALVCPSLTRNVWDQCNVPNKTVRFPRDAWGDSIWGRALTQCQSLLSNDPQRVPEGHLPIHRVIVTPIVYQDRAIGMLQMANSGTAYGPTQQESLEGIAAFIAPVLYARLRSGLQERRRRRAEDALRQAHEELERRVHERTLELFRVNEALQEEIARHARAAEALRASEAMLAEAQRIARVGSWEWDIPANALRWSDEVYRIFGLAPREPGVTYDTFLSLVHPDDRLLVADTVNEALEGKKNYLIEHRIERPDGEIRVVREQAEVFRDENGNAVRMLGTVQDITEIKRAEAQELVRRQHLVQADKMLSLGILVSGVAHEINNPNHSIMSNAAILKDVWKIVRPILDRFHGEYGDFALAGADYAETRERVPDMVSSILDNSKRIQLIVQELRDFARQSATEQMGMVDMNAVVKSANILVSNMVAKATDRFIVHGALELPKVRGNFQRLEQVVINLIQNACQSLPARDKAIFVSTGYRASTGMVFIEVRDEGAGIPSEILEHIMDPFFTTKRDSGGMGLGLWISSGIVHEHNGKLEFVSTPGQGTRAAMVLPAAARDPKLR